VAVAIAKSLRDYTEWAIKNRPLYYSVLNATAFVYKDKMTHRINC